jgi:hypothetical protein
LAIMTIWKFSVWAAAMALCSSYLMTLFFFLGSGPTVLHQICQQNIE